MSRENRMLVMFVVGMVALFTYFRVQYPNMGRVEELRPAEETPELRVLASADAFSLLEKALRTYELEFGIRIFIDKWVDGAQPEQEIDLLIRQGGSRFAETWGVEHVFASHQDAESLETSGASMWRFGVRSVSEARRRGAARLARYLVAADRGASLLGFAEQAEAWLDPWNEAPNPVLVVWEGTFSLYRALLKRFESIEGVTFQMIVGDCSLLEQKSSRNTEADGLLLLGIGCTVGGALEGWSDIPMNDLRPVFLSQQPIVGVNVSNPLAQAPAGQMGALKGLARIPDFATGLEWTAEWERKVNDGDFASFNRMQNLLDAVKANANLNGVAFGYSMDGLPEGVHGHWLPGRTPVRVMVSEASSHRHLVSRLARFLDSHDVFARP